MSGADGFHTAVEQIILKRFSDCPADLPADVVGVVTIFFRERLQCYRGRSIFIPSIELDRIRKFPAMRRKCS